MYKRYLSICLMILLLPIAAFAATQTAAQFSDGKQFKSVTPNASVPTRFQLSAKKVLVVEFFSYGCPWCFHLEPTVEKWLKSKPDYVEFKRIPVVFESGWQVYAKAYYTAEALGKLKTITPAIFNAIHKQGLDLSDETKMEKLFESHGVSKQDFESAYNFSPGIGVELQRASKLMLAYKVFQVPTFVIDGKYMTNSAMNKGSDKQLIQVVNYLVNKAKANKSIQ